MEGEGGVKVSEDWMRRRKRVRVKGVRRKGGE